MNLKIFWLDDKWLCSNLQTLPMEWKSKLYTCTEVLTEESHNLPFKLQLQKADIEWFNIFKHLLPLIHSCADSHKGTFLKSKPKTHSCWHICQALSPNHQNINRKGKCSIMCLCYVFFHFISVWPEGELEVCIQYRLSFFWF